MSGRKEEMADSGKRQLKTLASSAGAAGAREQRSYGLSKRLCNTDTPTLFKSKQYWGWWGKKQNLRYVMKLEASLEGIHKEMFVLWLHFSHVPQNKRMC